MGCGCKVNKQIESLKRQYGVNNQKSIKTNIASYFWYMMKNVLFFLLLLPIIPIILILIIIRSIFFKKKTINVQKTFKLKAVENV